MDSEGMPSEAGPGKCAVCSKGCSSQCSHCKKAWYCSKDCQLAHRKEHKPDCFPLTLVERIVNVENYGTSGVVTSEDLWVATRAIQQGEVMLDEKALIQGPSSVFVCEPMVNNQRLFLSICLGCCKILSSEPNAVVNKCSKCKWFMCDTTCEKKACHKMECDLFSRLGLTPSTQPLEYNFICYLRTIFLKFTQPIKWAQIARMTAAYARALEKEGKEFLELELLHASKFICETCGLFSQVDSEMLLHVISVWKAFRVEDIHKVVAYAICGIYPKNMFIIHSCRPNCISTSEGWNGTGNKLIATTGISAGEVLGRTNKGGVWMKGTRSRRNFLANRGARIICRCDRCKDPTECGTYFSAIKCPRKCKTTNCTETNNLGYILPLDPLNDKSDWKCNNPECLSTIEVAQVDSIMDPISKVVNATLDQTVQQPFDLLFATRTGKDLELMKNMERYLEKYKAVLHPNHHLFLELTMKLMIGNAPILNPSPQDAETKLMTMEISGDLDKSNLVRMAETMQERAVYCLQILDKIQPGFSAYRGKTLYLLAMAKWTALMDTRKIAGMDIPGVCNQDTTLREINAARQSTREAEAALLADACINNRHLCGALAVHAMAVGKAYARNPIWNMTGKN